MTLKSSIDSGASWPGPEAGAGGAVLLWPGPAAYSLVVPLADPADGALVGVVYERGVHSPYEQIVIGIVDVRT